jgi:voltage-gated potassium channel
MSDLLRKQPGIQMHASSREKQALTRERLRLHAQLERWLEMPLLVLALVWLILLVLDFIHGLSPLLDKLSLTIWSIFIADFVLRFTLAPH